MLCEQTITTEHLLTLETPIIYHVKKQNLIKNLNNLIENHFIKIVKYPNVYLLIINYYKSKIRKDIWLKNIASVHGLVRFCEVINCENNLRL